MSGTSITWDQIRQQFTDTDIAHMKRATGGQLDLSNCQSVQQWAQRIYDQVSSGSMPPGDPWSQDWVDNFQQWMNQPASSQCSSSQPSVSQPSVSQPSATQVTCQDPANPPTFYQDIVPLFRQQDVECMRNPSLGVLLLDYAYMSDPGNAQNVLDRLTGDVQPQMPYGGPYWSQDNITLFQQWMACGYKEGTPDQP
jgi:hypothetical protein